MYWGGVGWGGHVLTQFFREIILVTESILRTSRHTKPLVPTGNTLQCKVHVVACRALAKRLLNSMLSSLRSSASSSSYQVTELGVGRSDATIAEIKAPRMKFTVEDTSLVWGHALLAITGTLG